MLDDVLIQQLAAELDASERDRVAVEHFSKRFPAMTIDDGYRVGRAWVALQVAAGRRVIGHKIGLTSRAMQISSQIDEPDYGTLLDSMLFTARAGEVLDIPTSRFIAPRVEVELAFVLKSPLQGPDALTWPQALAHHLGLGWPRHKLLFSLPLYGYEWPVVGPQPRAATVGKARTTSYARVDAALLPEIRLNAREQAARHGAQRDAASGSPFYTYRDAQGQWQQGWYEDETSLAAKLDWLQAQGLAGAALFPLGYDLGAFDGLWESRFGASVGAPRPGTKLKG